MRPAALATLLVLSSASAHADRLDDFVRGELARRKVPGLSLAIIWDGKIVRAQGYGVLEPGSRKPVTPSTRFLAGSVSKPVTALGALRMVQQGDLALDDDVNLHLKSWKVPESELTRTQKVTLRRLLSHTAGLGVQGFPGYLVGEPLPTVSQVLDGLQPANTAPVRVEYEPGSASHYSGGGYTVVQLLMADVAGTSFEALMQSLVLAPAGMAQSSFQQPPSPELAATTAGGTTGARAPVKGRWHVYPEQAAAGLWTTPSDLARVALELQRTLAGRSTAVVGRDLARQMVTEVKDQRGLGVYVRGEGPTLQFSHAGSDEGFAATLVAFAERGLGVVVMINANDDSRMMARIVEEVAREYRWPTALPLPALRPVPAPALARYLGRYEVAGQLWTVAAHNGRLVTVANDLPDDELIAVGPDRFRTADGAVSLTFTATQGAVSGVDWRLPVASGSGVRLGPLAEHLKERKDPDPALTAKVQVALGALFQRDWTGSAFAGFTPGARRDFTGRDAWPRGRLTGLAFLDAQELTGRGLERRGSPVDRVLLYAVRPARSPRFLLAYLTADDQLADFDLVDQ